ncbi:MAG: ABC transporter permease, partial [bacterium]
MLKNHLKVALRNLRKHKGYSFINIAGLATGIACCLIIVLFVRDESSYEKFHPSAERVVRITYLFNNLQAGVATANASSPNIVASWLKENFYEFLDREYDALYRLEQRVGTLVQIFTGLAILVACFGLYGLASYSTVQRTKEIGVRKVLGATVTSIVRMLSSKIFRLIVIA